MFIYPVIIGYIMDLIFGDPQWFRLHPVRLIGKFIQKLENLLLTGNKRFNGILIVLIVVGTTFILVSLITVLMHKIDIYLWLAVTSFFIYTSISIKDLKVESMKVYNALEEKDLQKARINLSMIVGRDTKDLNEKEIIRATVETIAENTVDGIISPIFYAFIGGAPLALAYKAINTLDSMIGYRNEKYREFGWFAAKVDDIVNFLPAVISGILIPVASLSTGKNIINSFRIVFRDGIKNLVSGIPESAVAGALQVQLGGMNFYNSIPVSKSFLGDNINLFEQKHIKETINIAYICSILMIILGTVLWYIIKY
ncbi:MAG: adenosylcobinamide-phosphate synthase CbiB [Endomicrobiia bacterium]